MAKKINRIGKDLKAYLKKVKKREEKEASKAVLSEVKKRTPVDTGKARDSWKEVEGGLSNDCGYFEQLEEGHSKQAPLGVVKQSLKAVKDNRRNK